MSVPPDELVYGNSSPEVVCCGCQGFPLVSLAPPLCGVCHPSAERDGAALWRKDNPDKSVFDCDQDIKLCYMRIATGWLKKAAQP